MIIKVCDPRQTKVATGAGGGSAPPKRRADAHMGRSMKGLIRYLVGPGENNEHSNPTLVAASGTLGPEWSDAIWDDPMWGTQEVAQFARQLNAPMTAKRARGELAEDRAWVLHVAISMPPGERVAMDEWGQIAQEYITHMDLDDSGNKAPTRWAAFHHGQSKNGSDHIHLAVNMIREDGTWASSYQIKIRSQEARRTIEKAHGFLAAEQAAQQRDVTAYTVNDAHKNSNRVSVVDPATGRSDSRRVYGETDIEKLRRIMSAAAASVETEADYVQALWSAGVLTRPRFATGTRDVVSGYSVSLRPEAEENPYWMGGGQVRKDLALPKLRQRWLDTPEAATAAAQAWRRYHQTTLAPPASPHGRAGDAAVAAEQVSGLRRYLDDLDPAKVAEWRRAADLLSGAYAAWTLGSEPQGRGPLTRSMNALSRAAWAPRTDLPPTHFPPHSGTARAVRLIAQAGGRDDALGWLAVLQQLELCVRRVAEAQRARNEADEAGYLLANTEGSLATIRHRLESLEQEAGTRGHSDQAPSTRSGAGRDSRQGRISGEFDPLTDDQSVPKPHHGWPRTSPDQDRDGPER